MKRVSLLLVIAWAIAGGCADPLEQRTSQEIEGQFERGVTGGGTLGPIDRPSNDPAAEHSVPQTHP
jgi:hypothetical protein